MGVQRGGRGARRGGERDPADLGGRPRDRHHADRPRRRPARADPDGRGRARGAGAERARRSGSASSTGGCSTASRASCASSASGSRASRAACPTRRRCSARRASASTISCCACPMRWRAGSSAAGCRSGASPRACARRRSSCRTRRLRLASQADRLAYQLRGLLRDHGRQLERLAARLTLGELELRLARHGQALAGLAARQSHAAAQRQREAGERLEALGRRLASVSYESVLARGFALVRDEQAALVRDAESARRAAMLELEFRDGRVRTVVAPAAGAPGRRRASPPGRVACCERGRGRHAGCHRGAGGRHADRAPAAGDGAAARSGRRLPVGPRAELRDDRALHDRGGLRGRGRDRAGRPGRARGRARRPAAAGGLPRADGEGGRAVRFR